MNNQEKLKKKVLITRLIFWIGLALTIISLFLCFTNNETQEKIFISIFTTLLIITIIDSTILKKAKKDYREINIISKAIQDNKN